MGHGLHRQGTITLWLVESQSVANFVPLKNLSLSLLTVLAVAATVLASTTVARREALLGLNP